LLTYIGLIDAWYEIKLLTERLIVASDEMILGAKLISFGLSFKPFSFAYFHSGDSLNWHNCSREVIQSNMWSREVSKSMRLRGKMSLEMSEAAEKTSDKLNFGEN
jgi:hypothetical protein